MLRRFLAEHDVVNNVIFPAPNPPTYNETLPDLLWIGPERLQPVLFLPAPRARGLLLFLHGNAEDLGLLHAFVKSLQMALVSTLFEAPRPAQPHLLTVHSVDDLSC